MDYPPVPGPSGLPLVITVLGNPAAETETYIDAAAGYRLEIGKTAGNMSADRLSEAAGAVSTVLRRTYPPLAAL